jgi:hypothetical protein
LPPQYGQPLSPPFHCRQHCHYRCAIATLPLLSLPVDYAISHMPLGHYW